ncbi:MAG: SDR family NAD(P)-dependent oxidoreductase [Anaerolineaceae bacterium]
MKYNLENKTIIITGANSGIGKAAAIQLAQLGATVIMGCRSTERGLIALSEVKALSKSKKVEMLQIDLSSHESIKQFVEEFSKHHKKLDVLIHNAANFDHSLKEPKLTTDGVETIFATNHIGVFLLTQLLLDTLKTSSPSRIITVASKGLMVYPNLNIEFDNLNGERKFSVQHAYYHSKLAQIMFTYDLAQRLKGTGVTVNCVRVTNVAVPDDRLQNLPGWLKKLYSFKRKMSITPEQQAQTYVFLAADPTVEKITGAYWDENNHQVRSNRNSYDPLTWAKLWSESERLAGVDHSNE